MPVAILVLASPGGPHARDAHAGRIAIGHPWGRPVSGDGTPAAGYMTLVNEGGTEDRLIGATSPAAESVTLHTTEIVGGVSRTPVKSDGIAIPVHATIRLEPGGYHLMLGGLRQAAVAGHTIPLTLSFEKAGTTTVELAIEKRPAAVGERDSHGDP